MIKRKDSAEKAIRDIGDFVLRIRLLLHYRRSSIDSNFCSIVHAIEFRGRGPRVPKLEVVDCRQRDPIDELLEFALVKAANIRPWREVQPTGHHK